MTSVLKMNAIDKPATNQQRGRRELYEATRQFEEQSQRRSWWYASSTFALLIGSLILAGLVEWRPVRTLFSIVGGLLIVRAFILYHDFMHGAILRNSRLGRLIFHLYGLLILTPPRSWRYSHNFHHANVGKPIPVEEGRFSLITSDVGAFPLMTTDMWRTASRWQKIRYRVVRNPLTILTAYITVFLLSRCLVPLAQSPKKYWDGAISFLLHGGVIATLWIAGGFSLAFYAFMLPYAIAAMCGAYLFLAQHTFEGMRILPVEEWSHFRAALESSSYLKMGPIMNWFTGNIGYHHVHHLNSLIPFYRLPEAMHAIPELQSPIVTTLQPDDMVKCLRLTLWDVNSQRLVAYSDVK